MSGFLRVTRAAPGVWAWLGMAISLVTAAVPVGAEERYALIVSGASAGEVYGQQYDRWRSALALTLVHHLQMPEDHLYVLAETPSAGVGRATAAAVRDVLGTLRARLTDADLLLVVLFGHGSFDGFDAKFNLVGPDLEAAEWNDLLRRVPGRLIVVNTASASAPFMARLATRGRIIVTATDTAAQRYETIFPEFFVRAFEDPASDLDKNSRVSIWEAFVYASDGVRRWYEERGQLATERPVLDDDGNGVGREAGEPGPDGVVARQTFLDPDVDPSLAHDAVLIDLIRQRVDLEGRLEALKARKAEMSEQDYQRALEELLLSLARVSRDIRRKS